MKSDVLVVYTRSECYDAIGDQRIILSEFFSSVLGSCEGVVVLPEVQQCDKGELFFRNRPPYKGCSQNGYLMLTPRYTHEFDLEDIQLSGWRGQLVEKSLDYGTFLCIPLCSWNDLLTDNERRDRELPDLPQHSWLKECYRIGLNPLPAVRKKFTGWEWKWHPPGWGSKQNRWGKCDHSTYQPILIYPNGKQVFFGIHYGQPGIFGWVEAVRS